VRRRFPPRSKNRAEHWAAQIRDAPSGRDALSRAWDWLLSEQQSTRELRPGRADSACWEMALNVGLYASRMSRALIEKRSGLTADEVACLLNPWAKDTAEGERQ
jgi:hypothetical protein